MITVTPRLFDDGGVFVETVEIIVEIPNFVAEKTRHKTRQDKTSVYFNVAAKKLD